MALFFLAAPVEAAELEGFGPIKFGMSKEQAWRAVEGEGEWAGGDVLKYSYTFGRGNKARDFEVSQEFELGRASNATIEYFIAGLTPELCSWDGIRFADMIRHKYGVMPDVSFGTPRMSTPGDRGSYTLVDNFEFSYDQRGSIKINSVFDYSAKICEILMYYKASK